MTNGALLVFTRPPVEGRTKTRLIPLLGEEGAATLHCRLLRDTLVKAKQSCFETVEIFCSDTTDHPFLKACSREFDCVLRLQHGQDLGEKMHHAISSALVMHSFAVVIGSDCPSLTVWHLNQAHVDLFDDKDAVLGPAADGGYYLIGLRQAIAEVFWDIEWGGQTVAEETYKRFKRFNLNYTQLPTLLDIDTPEDYRRHFLSFANCQSSIAS